MIYFEEPHVTIRWDDKLKCVYVEWCGFVQGDKFRSTMDKALELVKQKNSKNWLADLREQRVTSVEDQDWLVNNWLPRCIQTGLKRSAIIVPENVLGQMSVTRIASKAGDTGSMETG